MRLTINGRLVEQLGDERSTHLFRAQAAQNKRLVIDLLLSDRELGQQEAFHLTAGGHTMTQCPMRVSGGGQRISWVLPDGLRRIGLNEILIRVPDTNEPWGIVEIKVVEPAVAHNNQKERLGVLDCLAYLLFTIVALITFVLVLVLTVWVLLR